jgi:hypothetical protein
MMIRQFLHIKPNPQPVSVENIQDVESRLGLRLPDSLKYLLLDYDGGDMAVNGFNTRFDDGDIRQYSLYHLSSLEEIVSAWGFIHDDPEIKENQILPFGDTLGSPTVCIGVGKHNSGKIYIMDWDFGVALQANTLEEFFSQLKYEKGWEELPPFKTRD